MHDALCSSIEGIAYTYRPREAAGAEHSQRPPPLQQQDAPQGDQIREEEEGPAGDKRDDVLKRAADAYETLRSLFDSHQMTDRVLVPPLTPLPSDRHCCLMLRLACQCIVSLRASGLMAPSTGMLSRKLLCRPALYAAFCAWRKSSRLHTLPPASRSRTA